MLELTRLTRTLLPLLIVLGASLFLQGCAANAIPILSTEGALASFKTIPNSPKAPCQMQKSVSAHNSAYDTLKLKKETVYKAPCVVDVKGKPKDYSKVVKTSSWLMWNPLVAEPLKVKSLKLGRGKDVAAR